MPEKIIFDSFNITRSYEFLEERIEPLKKLINKILYCETHNELMNSHEYKDQKFNFEYFKNLDKAWSKGFVGDTVAGNKKIKEALKKGENKFSLNGIDYQIQDYKAGFTSY